MNKSSNNILLHPSVIAMASEDEILEISEGNSGAITAIMRLIGAYSHIDPNALLGGHHVVMFLKDNNLKGTHINELWRKVCHAEPVKWVAMMRGIQLGFATLKEFQAHTSQSLPGYDFESLIAKIKERLPEFNSDYKEEDQA